MDFRVSRINRKSVIPPGPVTDSVAALNGKLESGEVRLERAQVGGYLRAVLDALKVPAESQLVVFSTHPVCSSRIYLSYEFRGPFSFQRFGRGGLGMRGEPFVGSARRRMPGKGFTFTR